MQKMRVLLGRRLIDRVMAAHSLNPAELTNNNYPWSDYAGRTHSDLEILHKVKFSSPLPVYSSRLWHRHEIPRQRAWLFRHLPRLRPDLPVSEW